MTKTNFPVARRGRLIRALLTEVGKTDRPTVLSFEQGESAIAQIAEKKSVFLAEQRAAVEAAAKDLGLPFRWCDDAGGLKGLSKAGRNRGLGAIYDFDEFAFELDGQLVVARACVTLCTMTEDERSAKADQLPLSKFWIRFMLVRMTGKDGAQRQAVGVRLSDAVHFGARYREVGDKVLLRIAPLYGEILAGVLLPVVARAKTDVTLKIDALTNGAFSVLALGTDSNDFSEVFDATRAGRRLADEMSRDDAEVAKQLVSLAFQTIVDGGAKRSRYDPKTDLKKALGERVRYIVYEGPTASRGLFLGSFEDNEVNFVGLTQSPQDGRPPEPVADIALSRLHSYSANTVSGGLVQEYALAF